MELNRKVNRVWIITWPFKLLFGLLKLVGRLAVAAIGAALIIAGIAATITVVGSVIGVPLIIIGAILFLRALF